jgi:hypothetical protein
MQAGMQAPHRGPVVGVPLQLLQRRLLRCQLRALLLASCLERRDGLLQPLVPLSGVLELSLAALLLKDGLREGRRGSSGDVSAGSQQHSWHASVLW